MIFKRVKEFYTEEYRVDEAIYPLTIIKDRYNGVYSDGKYLAFNLDFDEIPPGAIGDDTECRNFFDNCDSYGRGDSIEVAICDLYVRMNR